MIRRQRQSEQGYALIFVFAMAAMMALTLYLEMPRLALEMQRNKEELLIQRGEQYVRAIKVFTKKNKRYPQTIEELENTNGIRSLRHRYADPMTGKDEWRLIHADGSGRLTDSLVQKQKVPGQTEEQKSTNTFVSEGPTVGATVDPNSGRVAQALNRRASEQPGAAGAPPPPGTPNQAGGDPLNQQQQQNQQPYQQQNQQGQYPQQTTVPILGPNGQPIQRIPGLPGQFGAGGIPGQPYPSQAANSQTGGTVPQSGGYTFGSGYSGNTSTTGAPSGPQPMQPGQAGGYMPGGGGVPIPGGMPSGVSVNPATQMIQQILTRPNPQGMANIQGMQAGGQALGGGIAGVASKHDAEGIKIYNEKTNYKEWEFVYEPAKELQKALGGMAGQIPGMNNQNNGFGNSSGQSGFGSQQQGGFGSQQPGGLGNSSMPTQR
jgi:hypothetical protein